MNAAPEEEWRDIPGYEGYYQASSLGRIRSVERVISQRHATGEVQRRMPMVYLTPFTHSGDGRFVVALSRDCIVRKFGVHVLVALAFLGPKPHAKSQCCHRDGDHINNSPENLYWGDNSSNVQDAIRHGTHYPASKITCPYGHALRSPNLKGSARQRACKACANANEWARRRRVKGTPFSPDDKREYADMRYLAIMAEA